MYIFSLPVVHENFMTMVSANPRVYTQPPASPLVTGASGRACSHKPSTRCPYCSRAQRRYVVYTKNSTGTEHLMEAKREVEARRRERAAGGGEQATGSETAAPAQASTLR